MKLTTRRFLLAVLILALALIPLHAALAKGPPTRIDISGPGIDGTFTITDPDMLEPFGMYYFNDLERLMSSRVDFRPDVELGEGYRIERYFETVGPWDAVTYYPDPAGGVGYIYFDGLLMPGMTTQGQGLWFRARPDGDKAMRQIIAEASLYKRSPAPTGLASSEFRRTLTAALVALGSLLLIVAVVLRIRQHRELAPAM